RARACLHPGLAYLDRGIGETGAPPRSLGRGGARGEEVSDPSGSALRDPQAGLELCSARHTGDAADDSMPPVQKERGRKAGGVEADEKPAVRVEDAREAEAVAACEGERRGPRVHRVDPEHGDAGVRAGQAGKGRSLVDAPPAPGGPEVDDDRTRGERREADVRPRDETRPGKR